MPAATPEEVALLTTHLAGLNQAIADGVRQVTVGGQTVTYNTTASLITARDDVATRLTKAEADVAGRRKGSRQLLFYAGRGYD